MLVEARAAGYVYHAPNDRLEVRASPDARGGQATLATAALLLSAAGKLVGVDLRETPAGCVLMLGAHEDVSSQVKAPVHVAVDGDGALVAVTIDGASRLIESPAKNAY